jgi:acetamidase/formamidase
MRDTLDLDPLPEKTWVWKLDGEKLTNDEVWVTLDWQPFVGTLAVAPDLEAISALAPGPFGGNMDVPNVCPGNTVYLPVWNEWALFYTGTAKRGRVRASCAG